MNVTIRNQRVLNWLGFYRAPGAKRMFASLPVRMWLEIIWRKVWR